MVESGAGVAGRRRRSRSHHGYSVSVSRKRVSAPSSPPLCALDLTTNFSKSHFFYHFCVLGCPCTSARNALARLVGAPPRLSHDAHSSLFLARSE